ncbi:MAG: phenylacetic acid degradation-like protein [Xanthobacteraceae bacterium]|nr:phenylacetic acid degradation-like protein [Xanthobacteraceae bacterium]
MTESAISYLRRSLALPPFHQWLRPELVEADEATGKVTLVLAVRPEFLRDPDRPEVHGGIIAAFIDIAGHAAVAGNVRHGVPTIDLRVDYLRMASGAVLKATAEPVRIGRTIGVVDVRVTDDKDVLVALGRGVFSTRTG